ncbi:hypothetical protein L2E82_12563 [Cichorium intybus]|uniref:Uncharacterized protein n=1 Tax=Cichorium intybus TaxID=13427 RepID=A0ACB9GFV1_CICIN|nr:hypothetical protein L2E82_12563 [Cichorium intybus]
MPTISTMSLRLIFSDLRIMLKLIFSVSKDFAPAREESISNHGENGPLRYDEEARRIRGEKAKVNFPVKASLGKPQFQKAVQKLNPTSNHLGYVEEKAQVNPAATLEYMPAAKPFIPSEITA